jgi:hypothetical protein
VFILWRRFSRVLTASAFASALLCGFEGSDVLAADAGEGDASSTAVHQNAASVPAVASLASRSPADDREPRYEPAGFPLIAGNSDIGFEFGVVGTLSRFANGVLPYQWNMDLVAELSLKSGPSGAEITQQSYQWNIDAPQVAGGRVRLAPQLGYYRTVNQLYFGLGNASSGQRPAGASARYFEFDDRQARFRELTRVGFSGPFDVLIATIYRYQDPRPYTGGQLEKDAASNTVRGVRPLSLFTLAGGIQYDSRDNEIFPLRGSLHHLGLRATLGVPSAASVHYAAFGAQAASFIPIGASATIALRAVTDLELGHVPVYDLYTGGAFLTDEMIGGSSAVRGVPNGRYSGLVKVFANAELRAMLVPFRLLGQQFRLGGNLLFDTGRLWSDYSFKAPQDGTGLGLKWGAGGGAYLQWGQAAVFRLEIAYSPDAKSENPGLPLGIYVEDGVMF